MSYKINWSATARNDYFTIIDYLLENWGNKSAHNFKNKVDKQLKLISRMPKIFPKTEIRKNLRRCVVVKQVTMYYLEKENSKEIFVTRFYDNRKDPDKLTDALNKGNL
ncbi:MAG: type II toxin-antitoxin system RelE/ParE family toxin [Bacteroidales bacterium]|nr:type II toxin-antitoxin system RelE/ParE family toxin [Bacteroidales bacterium]